MYIEFYIDQFLAEYFLTGVLLLGLAVRLEKRQVSMLRILLGSFLNTVSVVLGLLSGITLCCLTGPVAAGIVTAPDQDRNGRMEHLFMMFFLTLCFGGVLGAWMELLPGSVLTGSIAAICILYSGGKGLEKYWRVRNGIVTVWLVCQGKKIRVQGLIDSGNQLTEPFTGKPVSIIEEECAKKLLGENWILQKGVLLIPYHSIGKENGWLQGVVIDRITSEERGQKGIVISHPLIAVYKGNVSAKGHYQMILHPMHVRAGSEAGGYEE